MRSAIKIFLSLHTQVSRAEKQMRREDCFGVGKLTSRSGKFIKGEECGKNDLDGFGFAKLDDELIGGKNSLPLDACIMLKGERGTHKFAVAANYLFQGLREGENVVLFNMGSPIEIDRIPQFDQHEFELNLEGSKEGVSNGGRVTFYHKNQKPTLVEDSKSLIYSPFDFKAGDRPPEGKYKLHWWMSNLAFGSGKKKGMEHFLQHHGNLFILDFDAGFLFPEEFISTLTELWEWVKRKVPHPDNSKPFIPFRRVLLNSTAQIKTRFPVLEEETFLIPSFIRLTKCYGISSMIIDVLPPGGVFPKNAMLFDALSDLIITIKHNFDLEYSVAGGGLKGLSESELKILTADNITGKVYKKKWLGFWIEEKAETKKDPLKKRVFSFVDVKPK